MGAEAIAQVAEVIELRAAMMPQNTFAGLVRMSLSLAPNDLKALNDLKAPTETQRSKQHRSPRYPPAPEDSVVGEVNKATLLQVAEEVLTQEKLKAWQEMKMSDNGWRSKNI